MTPKEIFVIKRDGVKTPLDLDKIHRMVELACNGLAGVSEVAGRNECQSSIV